MNVFVIILCLLLSVGVFLDGTGTFKRVGWKIHFVPLVCPRCGMRPPLFRTGWSLPPFMWGSWICKACGTSVDNWGHELAPPATAKNERNVSR
jgi:hypothetical protein